MNKFDAIVIGSSAGGVTALKKIVQDLPPGFKTPVFIVQHIAPHRPSDMADILDRVGPLSVVTPVDGQKIAAGLVYIAPPDHHMLIEGNRILIKRGPKENTFRPSIDALFRSAAYTYGPGVIGVVLTGMLGDGSSGMWSIKRMGGITIIQDPEEAQYASMPSSVLEYVNVDHISSLSDMATLLTGICEKGIISKPDTANQEVKLLKMEADIAALTYAFDKGIIEMGELSSLTCPDCGGALTSFKEGHLLRYRCHTGHAYSSASLLSEVTETAENKLWQALRSLEEAVIIVEKEADVSQYGEGRQVAMSYSAKIQSLRRRADELHKFINLYLEFSNIPKSNLLR